MDRRLLLFFLVGAVLADPIVVNQEEIADVSKTEAMSLLLMVMPTTDTELLKIVTVIGQNLGRSGQFRVSVRTGKEPATHEELSKLFDKAYPLQIFFTHLDGGKSIGWRLYDVHDGQLIKGMKYGKRGSLRHGFADNVSDEIWPVLTHQSSSFSTKIAYVKRKKGITQRANSVICIANSDGSHEQEIINTPGTYVSLYWHQDTQNPCLFCSEFTRFNVRLISANLFGKKSVVLNLKGTCVGISVAHDNQKAVYCRSGTIWQYRYDLEKKQARHTALIKNEGKNVSPTLLENGDVIFCSDAASLKKNVAKGGPQICYYSAQDGTISLLTREGYNVGPSYCPATRKIAYGKKVKGIMQLYVYNLRTKQHACLTDDLGNKIDCCWSPCGNFLLYCVQQNRTSRIAVMNMSMKKRSFITPADAYCSCPAWSRLFEVVPVMRQ